MGDDEPETCSHSETGVTDSFREHGWFGSDVAAFAASEEEEDKGKAPRMGGGGIGIEEVGCGGGGRGGGCLKAAV